MKRYWIFFLLGITSIADFSCKKKEYPVPSTGNPVFYFDGTINGNPVNIKAGVNDYYMYSSFVQDANGVYNFYSDLKPFNCSSCTNSIKFQINDYKVLSSNASVIIDTSLLPGYYSYQVPGGTPLYVANFTSILQGGNASTYLWNFGDGITSAAQNPSHTYSKPGYYNTCLTIIYAGTATCTSSIYSEVKVGVPDATCSATFTASPSTNGSNVVNFLSTSTGVGPFTYSWDFGDGNTANSGNPAHTYTYSASGLYKVCLKVIDSQGCTSNVCKNVTTAGFKGCATNFSYYQNSTVNQLSLSGIIITWTDATGMVYTSKNYTTTIQPSDSYFRIISVENYSNNQNDQKTKKLHINFKCKVFNSANSLQIDNGDAIIAVSYK